MTEEKIDTYKREVNAINYLRKLGLLKFENEGNGVIRVMGDQMLWSSGGQFRSSCTFYMIYMRKRIITEIKDIKELV